MARYDRVGVVRRMWRNVRGISIELRVVRRMLGEIQGID